MRGSEIRHNSGPRAQGLNRPMYYQYFGLQDPPFSIAVNPRYLYMSPRHSDALAHLLYGVGAGGGFILLTGEVGTGKTTLNRCLLEQLPDEADVAIVLNPALDSRDLLATVCEELAIDLPVREERPGLKTLTDALHHFLLANHGRGRKTVLIIDEAQHLSFEVLEQIRLLTNLETHEEKLLHIILIGQPELAEKLRRPELRQLNQRITARYELQPLTAEETGAYIRHRLQVAGMAAGRELFPATLVRRIHERSRGVPRLVNLLCDRMLLGAYGQGSNRLDVSLLRQASKEVLGEADAKRRALRGPLWITAVLVSVVFLLPALMSNEPWRGDDIEPDVAVVATTSEMAGEPMPLAPVQSQQAARGVAVDTSASDPMQSTAANGLLPPATGARLLRELYGLDAQIDPCAASSATTLRCEQRSADTWDALLAENRPLLLALRDDRRFAASAVFLGIEGDNALLVNDKGVVRAGLSQLAAHWTGEYSYYWQVPDDWSGAVSQGDSGPSVRSVAVLFARLDGQDRPLTEDQYSAALAERVRLFQGARGLERDGVAGENTVRELVLAAGADLSRERALDELAARVEAGQWP